MALKPIDKNQHTYLTNLAAGKTEKGIAANAGQQSWAKEQLAGSSYTPPKNGGVQGTGGLGAALSVVKSEVVPAAKSTTQSTITQAAGGAAPLNLPNITSAQPFEFKEPEKFSYDKNTDPGYLAALASARESIGQQQLDTNAVLRGNGQGKSSYSEQVANQIGAKEMGRVATDVLPTLINQAYQQYSDNTNRSLQVQQANYGITRDQAGDAFTEAGLTGRYVDPKAESYAKAITDLGRAWSDPNATPEQKSMYHQQAEDYRAALRSMGVDSELFGSNVSTEDRIGNMSKLGVQTLDSINQNAVLTGKLPNGQNTVSEKQRIFANEITQLQFEEQVRQFGIQEALQKQVQLGNLSINQAQLILAQDDNDRQWATLDWEMQQPADDSTPDYRGLTASQILDNIQPRYSEPVYKNDKDGNQILDNNGNPKEFGSVVTSDPAKREQMFLDVIDSNLPTDNETYQVLTMLGLTKKEIETFKKKYSGN